MGRVSKRRVLLVAINLLVVGVAASGASAHTEADVVAVPAGTEATVTLKPTHGCGSSPTVEVAIQAPVEGAVAADVAGWQATSTDGDGTTVLEWTGGSLAADQVGAFPVSFSVPDSVANCSPSRPCRSAPTARNWPGSAAIPPPSTPPLGSSCWHRVLPPPPPSTRFLPMPPARASLTEVVDVDNPASNTTSTSTSTTTEPTSTTTSTSTTTDPPEAPDQAEESDSSDDSASGWLVVGAGVLALGAGAGVVWMRRRGQQA